jgi:hypothetical protein
MGQMLSQPLYAANMRRLALVAALVAAALAATTTAQHLGSEVLDLDFTKPAVRSQAKWTEAPRLTLTPEGLVFSAPANQSIDLSIESIEPLAIGTVWRPATSAAIELLVEPPASVFPYVRYGPDTRHWSSWQALQSPGVAGGATAQKYTGYISIPWKDQVEYSARVSEYQRRDVPWASDEEAAVKWVVASDPAFFSRNIPFAGYVQFLVEGNLRGGQRVSRISARVSWAVSGFAAVRPGGQRPTGPWRYRP